MSTYPDEVDLTAEEAEALDGTTHEPTGLTHVPTGTDKTDDPTYETLGRRWEDRIHKIIAAVRELQVVDEGGRYVGVYPGRWRCGDTDKAFDGATGQQVYDNDTTYIYLDSTGALQLVTDATGWPTEPSTYMPLAEVTAASGDITAIVDVRGRGRSAIGATGTTGATFQLNADASGPKLKDSSGTLQVRNAGDSDYADLACDDLTVDGDLTVTGSLARIKQTVTNKTADYTLTTSDSGTVFTNLGASTTITFSLPTGAVGLCYRFVVAAAYELRVDPGTNDKVLKSGSGDGKYIKSSTEGDSIALLGLSSGDWAIAAINGTWTLET